ncbi:MAG: hypothetical protein V7607_191 [Solirubrobacteraceae bacterium]
MKVSLFANPSYLDKGVPGGWPVAPKHWDREVGAASMAQAFEIYDMAHELGFDWLTVAEHHYVADLMGPNPLILAGALAHRYEDVTIAVLGALAAFVNPVRLAEEFATVDALSNGRLIAGVFPGTPNECLTYGANPEETRERFREAVQLIARAWTEPEPFWWEGRYFRFPVVSIWPRPVQTPRPPMLTSGTSPASAQFAGRHQIKLGLSFAAPPERCAELVALHRESALEAGWEPTQDDVLYRVRVHVADSDDEAERICRKYDIGNAISVMTPRPDRAEAWGRMMAAAAGRSGHRPPGPGAMPEFYGDPDTVARQILESAGIIGFGILDVTFGAHQLPLEHAVSSLELFGREVLPRLQAVGDAGAERAA